MPTIAPMTADVVIPTWRAREMLRRCLLALLADPSQKRVIVVDNASADGTVELVRNEFPDVVLVELHENLGFGRAVNAGVEAGTGPAIVLINNDVLVAPGFVDAIVAPLASPAVGMVAGLTTIPDTELVDGFGIELDRTLAAYNRARRAPVGTPAGRLAMPSGGAAAYRRPAWRPPVGSTRRCSPTARTSTLVCDCGPPAGRQPRRRPLAESIWEARRPGSTRPSSATWLALRAGSCSGATEFFVRARHRERSLSRLS